MSFVGGLRRLIAHHRFRQLFAVRVTSQCGDGIFQVALASYLLFSPERQPDATAIAAALAAVLLPFSVLGPFVGVFLDRWNRQQILAWANAVRTGPVLVVGVVVATSASEAIVFALTLVAFSINRFFLAGLSAALPRVVAREELLLANSVTPTCGTLAVIVGVAVGSGVRLLPIGGNPDVLVIAVAATCYLAAAATASRIPRDLLGPDPGTVHPGLTSELGRVVGDLGAGLSHLHQRRAAATALATIAAGRFLYGLSTVATVLLYRNYFHGPDDTDAALSGLSLAILVSGLGFFAAAVLTPVATDRLTPQAWMVSLLLLAALAQIFPGALYTQPAVLVAAFALGLSAQGVKICVDTLVQTGIDDAFRGRVFVLYDVIFNVVFVASAGVGALVIPSNGKSYALLVVIAAAYAATAAAYARVAPLARVTEG